MEIISLQDVTLTLQNRPLFRDLNFSIREGEKVLLRGPSGSGKSTLLRIMTGLVTPEKGDVLFMSEHLKGEMYRELRKNTAFVPQNLQLGEGIVEEIIRDIFAYRANRHLEYDRERALEVMDMLSLPPHLLEQKSDRLSGGETQRFALLVGILLERRIFLLDEVTAGVDEELKGAIARHFMTHPAWTVAVVSHDREWKGFDHGRVVEMEDLLK
jgi:putative ABC transport system ATP-binding protein